MIKKSATFLTIVTFLFVSHASQADNFLDMLNVEAKVPVVSENIKEVNSDKSNSKTLPIKKSAPSPIATEKEIRIIDKISANNSSYMPKNKNEPDYRQYLKEKYRKTYLQYIKLDLDTREQVYEQYAEKSFPRIEDTREIIMRLLK